MSTYLHGWDSQQCYKTTFLFSDFAQLQWWVFLTYFRFFMPSRYWFLIKSMTCKHSSSFLACHFTLLVISLAEKVFNFNEVQLTRISFTTSVFGSIKSLPDLMTWGLSSAISSKTFLIALTSWSWSCVGLFFNIRKSSNFKFYVWMSSFLNIICWKHEQIHLTFPRKGLAIQKSPDI